MTKETSAISDVVTIKTVTEEINGEARRKASPGARLWADRNFNLFWAGQTFDAVGDSAALIIIPLLVLDATGSVAQMGLVAAVMGVGNLISSLISGILVDRIDRRRIMILCDIGRAVFYLPIPLIWLLIGPSLWVVYVVAAITAYLSIFFIIAYTTAIPNIVESDQITEANGRLQVTVALAYVVGPMLAGFASKQLNPTQAIFIVVASYAISAILMLFVRLRKSAGTTEQQTAGESTRGLSNFFAGIRFLLNHRVLKPVTLLLAATYFITGATINLSIYRLKHDLNQTDYTVGIVFGVASIGAILAGVLAPMLRRSKGFGFCFLGGSLLIGMAILLTGLAPGVFLMAVLATAYSFGNTIRNINSMSLRQQVTPDQMLGRVSSAFWILLTVFGPLGTAAASMLAEWISASLALIIAGALCIFIAIAGLFTRANMKHPEKTDVVGVEARSSVTG